MFDPNDPRNRMPQSPLQTAATAGAARMGGQPNPMQRPMAVPGSAPQLPPQGAPQYPPPRPMGPPQGMPQGGPQTGLHAGMQGRGHGGWGQWLQGLLSQRPMHVGMRPGMGHGEPDSDERGGMPDGDYDDRRQPGGIVREGGGFRGYGPR